MILFGNLKVIPKVILKVIPKVILLPLGPKILSSEIPKISFTIWENSETLKSSLHFPSGRARREPTRSVKTSATREEPAVRYDKIADGDC